MYACASVLLSFSMIVQRLCRDLLSCVGVSSICVAQRAPIGCTPGVCQCVRPMGCVCVDTKFTQQHKGHGAAAEPLNRGDINSLAGPQALIQSLQ